MSIFTKRVNNDNDDGYQWPPSTWYSDEIKVGKAVLGDAVNFAVRFTVVNIPQGATINSAKLTFQKWWTQTYNLVSKISGIDEDNTANFSANPMGRSETSAKVDWDENKSWVADTEYDTPDITSIVQEIVNRPGWGEGQAMGFFIKDDGQPETDRQLAFYDYNRSTTRCAFLTINFTGVATITKTCTAKASIGRHMVTCVAKASIFNPRHSYGWKVSKPNKSIFTSDTKNLIFSSGLSLLKIINQGTANLNFSDGDETEILEITHGLNYPPAFLVFLNTNQNDKVIADGAGGFATVDYCRLDAYVNNTKLWIRGRRVTTAGAETKIVTYFILADPA